MKELIIHILPIKDIYYHIEDTNCMCDPQQEILDKSILAIHNAYDGRDRQEQLITKLNNLINES